MASIRLTNGVQYSVVGRYMTGSMVSGYHLLGEDGSQLQVSKQQLIRLVDKNIVVNCRVQMYNDNPLLRGKGINLNELPVFDEKKNELKKGTNIGAVRPKTNDPNAVFGQLLIVKRIMQGNHCVGYVVRNAGGLEKKLSRDKVIAMASQKLIGNARVQKDNDKILLRGVGESLDALPIIVVTENGNKEAEVKIPRARKVDSDKQSSNSSNSSNENTVTIGLQELIDIGNRGLVLNKEMTTAMLGVNKVVGIEEIREGKARVYIQGTSKSDELNIDEFVTTIVKFGNTKGVIMRVIKRSTKETVDIKEVSLDRDKINEKILIGIMCCGIIRRFGIDNFGLVSIQSNDASSERAYEFSS